MAQLHSLIVWSPGLVLAFLWSDASAQNADELAQQLSNPIASVIGVPMQLNYDDGYGPGGDGNRFGSGRR